MDLPEANHHRDGQGTDHGDGQRISRGVFPPLITDGRIDILTGLDAPEIFYKFLEQSISRSARRADELTALIRFRMSANVIEDEVDAVEENVPKVTDFTLQSQQISSQESSASIVLDFQVAALADFLKRESRADENLTRIGEGTFLLLVRVANDEELGKAMGRFSDLLADFCDLHEKRDSAVEIEELSIPRSFEIALSGFLYEPGESMLNYLERVEV